MQIMITGALGSDYGIGYTLFYATNFIFTGLAVAIAFHARLFNIGGEGQAAVAGVGVAAVCLTFDGTHWLLAFPLAIIGAGLFGAAWALIPGWLQAKRGSHIVITTIMFNYIAAALLIYLLNEVFKVPGAMAPESRGFEAGAHIPRLDQMAGWVGISLSRTPVNITLLLALIACVFVWLLIWRSRLGYEIRAFGHSESAAVYAGISPVKITVIAMLLSGAMAGMMSLNTVMGELQRLNLDTVQGAGFVGIAVALMGRNHPIGVLLAAMLVRRAVSGRDGAGLRDVDPARADRHHSGAGDPVHRQSGEPGALPRGQAVCAHEQGGRVMLEYLPALALAWSIQLTGTLTPGPAVALILGVAAAQGRRSALILCVGIACASIVLSVATVLGLAAAVAQVAELMVVVRILGAAWLAWLAYGAFRRALNPPPLRTSTEGHRHPLVLARTGFALQVLNPKAIAFWLAIAAVGGIAGAPWPVIATFVAGCFVVSFCGHGVWALLFSLGTRARCLSGGAATGRGILGHGLRRQRGRLDRIAELSRWILQPSCNCWTRPCGWPRPCCWPVWPACTRSEPGSSTSGWKARCWPRPLPRPPWPPGPVPPMSPTRSPARSAASAWGGARRCWACWQAFWRRWRWRCCTGWPRSPCGATS